MNRGEYLRRGVSKWEGREERDWEQNKEIVVRYRNGMESVASTSSKGLLAEGALL